ncbi:MAG: serine hydrolase domain-containing protein [Phycisphaerales bacterium]
MSRLLRLVLAAVFVVVTPVAWAQPPSDSELELKVDAAVAKALAEPGAAGYSIAVARAGKVILAKGYGPADVELSVPVSADSIFRIGSVTKQFTAAAVMRLVEAGTISLDATVQTYVPDFPVKQWPVTVRHLLTHTSGIWSYTEDEKFMGRDSSLELTPTELIATFADKPLEFEPGTKFNYSNSAYYLLGAVVEKASGKPYAAYVQEELFGPLGLSHTRYENNAEIIPGRAQGYTLNKEGKLANDKAIGADVPGAAGSLLSTAGDLVRWEIALSGGTAVKPESYAQMTTSAVLADGKETRYGFGLAIRDWEGRRRISHGGGIFGFSSFLLTLPDDGLTVAVLSNSDAVNSGRVADTVARLALGLAVFEPKDLALSPTDIARFSGEFAFESIPLEIRFFDRDGKMWAQATGQQENRLLYQGDGEFRASFDATVKFVFAAGADRADSFVLHQGGGTISAKRKK